MTESDVLCRERRVGSHVESIYDPVKVRNAIRVLKELLGSKGIQTPPLRKRARKFGHSPPSHS